MKFILAVILSITVIFICEGRTKVVRRDGIGTRDADQGCQDADFNEVVKAGGLAPCKRLGEDFPGRNGQCAKDHPIGKLCRKSCGHCTGNGIGNCALGYGNTCTNAAYCHNGGSCWCDDGPSEAKCFCINGFTGKYCTIPPGVGCDSDQFRCDNGNCIKQSWVLDGAKNCGDNSDERNQGCQDADINAVVNAGGLEECSKLGEKFPGQKGQCAKDHPIGKLCRKSCGHCTGE